MYATIFYNLNNKLYFAPKILDLEQCATAAAVTTSPSVFATSAYCRQLHRGEG